jgi:outer membrane receptor protein involved in Fe transport
VFGELSYYPIPRLKITAGVRELWGRDSETDVSSGFFASTPFHSGEEQANAFTPKFSVSYDINQSVTAYATAGKGFRLGGVDAPVPAVQCAVDLQAFGLTQAPDTYQSDKVWNYEIGSKGLYFDRTTSINAAVYDIEWDQIQLDVPLKTCGFDFYSNLGHARSYGTELEIAQRIGRSLTVGLTGQYNHDTFTEDLPGLGITKGDMVPGSPRWSYGVNADFEHRLTGTLRGFFRGNWQYVGTSHGTFVVDNPDYVRASYGLLGLSMGVSTETWELAVYAKNLLDENRIIQSPSDNFVSQGYTPVPRMIGITGNVRF